MKSIFYKWVTVLLFLVAAMPLAACTGDSSHPPMPPNTNQELPAITSNPLPVEAQTTDADPEQPRQPPISPAGEIKKPVADSGAQHFAGEQVSQNPLKWRQLPTPARNTEE